MDITTLNFRELAEREEIAWELWEQSQAASTAYEWAFRSRAYERWQEASDELDRRRALVEAVRRCGVGGDD